MIHLPEDVRFIIKKLNGHGYNAYIVGGCVRDSLLGEKPKDWDLATDAHPEMINTVFNKTIEIGKRFGTIAVHLNGKNYEITTFRRESTYSDSRRPDQVMFTEKIEEDLRRRDFTINAMAYNSQNGLIDLFKGQDDLKNKQLRCVGNPQKRFDEDALRIMRGIRIAAQLQFEIEPNTYKAMMTGRHKLKVISMERIQEELSKILLLPKPVFGITLSLKTGVLETILPEVKGIQDVCKLKVLDKTDPLLSLRLTILFDHINCTPDEAVCILKRLKYDSKTIKSVDLLLSERRRIYQIDSSKALKKVLRSIGRENFLLLLKLYRSQAQDLSHMTYLENTFDRIIKNKEPVNYEDLKVRGEDFVQADLKGVEIGQAIEKLLDMVYENPENNNRAFLLNKIEQMKTKPMEKSRCSDGRKKGSIGRDHLSK